MVERQDHHPVLLSQPDRIPSAFDRNTQFQALVLPNDGVRNTTKISDFHVLQPLDGQDTPIKIEVLVNMLSPSDLPGLQTNQPIPLTEFDDIPTLADRDAVAGTKLGSQPP
ncbi:MAG: hypothetical protein WA399_06640 [Acidobacteriaceae bacterium]